MDNNLRFVIGVKDGDTSPLERDEFRAYFYWQEGASEVQRSCSVEELEAHIAECKAKGAPTALLEAALKRLRRLNAHH